MRDAGVLKAAHHMEQRIDVLQAGEIAGHLLALPFQGGLSLPTRQTRKIHIVDRRVSDLFRLKNLGQLVQTGVGDVSNTDMGFALSSPRGSIRLPERQQIEDCGFAHLGETDDSYPHPRPSLSKSH